MKSKTPHQKELHPQTTITTLQARIQELETEIADLTLLHETTVEHGTTLENELIDLVATLTTVARELEVGRFDVQSLRWLIDRPDELGELGRVFQTMGNEVIARDRRLRMLRVIIPAGVALSAEKDFNRLLETILIEAQKLSHAVGGMLYLLTSNKTLQAMIGRNETLGIAQGGTSGVAIDFYERLLYDSDGNPNHQDVIAHAALTNQRVNVVDTYTSAEFEFAAMHAFDREWAYRTQSLITIPLCSERDEVIGVLQLINATDSESGKVIPFAVDDVVETLILLTSAALSSYLREEQLRSEINRLQIQIDPQRMAQQVTEITETDFFQDLQARAKQMRRQKRK